MPLSLLMHKLFLDQAIWENQYYYLFGFLFLVFIILVVSVSQIAVVMVYFQLCGEVNCLKTTSYQPSISNIKSFRMIIKIFIIKLLLISFKFWLES